MCEIMSAVFDQIIPGIRAYRANHTVEGIEKQRLNFEVDLSNIDENNEDELKEYIKEVRNDLEVQHDRKKIIEDKAKSLMSIIAVSITAITFSLGYLNSLVVNKIQISAVIILIISVIYFAMGAIRALQTLNIRKFYIVQTEIQISSNKFTLIKKQESKTTLIDLIKKKQLNDLINIRLSNYAFASFNLIRNGIILFVVFFILTIGVNLIDKNHKTDNSYHINKTVQLKIDDLTTVNIPYSFDFIYVLKNLNIDKDESINTTK